ncbi:hypothetical protein ALI22I_32485 [Saccharothrix sp. ALI-22-I]|uniref:hypothetical protein n=1 Tax=Saccharothrix sp. ALI-22-I TaxID=1933778 RepID=UPI00097C154A|nr:hypothetical protein [Saccharothrix sp. ALI-22-I]ONI83268.1 hypothetical protein ALI22I_32485 [Saccharothrix sp. ALI-22-I]
MRRFLLALVPLALVACTAAPAGDPAPTTSSLPKGDLAVLAERIEQRRAELGTALFHTEGFASDGQATEVRNVVDGAVRQDADGQAGSMTMDVSTGGQPKKIALVVVRDGMYVQVEGAPMPEGKKWGFYTAANGGEVSALLRGFGPSATVGAELDYVQPRAALIVNKGTEQLDGVPATRFDLVVDPLKMAKVIENQDIQLQHTQLAEYGVKIAATVWVDDTNAPLKAEYRFELDGKVVKQSTTRFRDWGKPVEITVPDQGEVVPADQLPQ